METSVRPPRRRRPNWALIRRDYLETALSIREIAAARGVSHTAINKRAKKGRWERLAAPSFHDDRVETSPPRPPSISPETRDKVLLWRAVGLTAVQIANAIDLDLDEVRVQMARELAAGAALQRSGILREVVGLMIESTQIPSGDRRALAILSHEQSIEEHPAIPVDVAQSAVATELAGPDVDSAFLPELNEAAREDDEAQAGQVSRSVPARAPSEL